MTRKQRTRANEAQASLFTDSTDSTVSTDSTNSTYRADCIPPGDAAAAASAADTARAAPVLSLDAQAAGLPAAWRELLAPCLSTDGWRRLADFVDGERAAGKPVFPREVFHALHLTPPDAVKVVILGQDPYHGTGVVDGAEIPQAHGLAFSVPDGIRVPPSLRNIFKEIAAEFGEDAVARPSASGNLEHWARQGVLLLNTVLTVEQGQAASHARRGWEAVTDCLIGALAASRPKLVFLLWGSHAQAKASLIGDTDSLAGQASRAGATGTAAGPDNGRRGHLVLEAPHPSPLSAHRGFLGCGHFRAANDWLAAQGRQPVDWASR